MANDVFANVAANGIGGRMDLLTEITPREIKKVSYKLEDTKDAPISTFKKIDKKAELFDELKKMRGEYEPFLKNYAPQIENKRKRLDLKEFTLNGDEKITLPHYGGPVGYHKNVYETEFEFSKKDNKAYYICLKGADYYAVCYINDVCVGTHEGFFSPFEFLITENLKDGKNKLKIELYNDYIYMGNAFASQEQVEGDKLYAATGLGWDDAKEGWHHCPAGMGLYNDVYVEEREIVHITDLYVRPLLDEKKQNSGLK